MSLDSIRSGACAHPSRAAVIHNGTRISYIAFYNAIRAAFNHVIDKQDLSRGQNAVVIVHDLLDCWVAVFALQALGLNTICIRSTEALNILVVKSIATVVTTQQEHSKHQLAADATASASVITIPSPCYRNEAPCPDGQPLERQTTGDHILYSSGTTGNYKKIVSSAAQQTNRDEERIQQMHLNEDSFFYCSDYGLWTSVGYMLPLSTWRAQGCVIFDQRPDWAHHFLKSGVTRAVLLPDKLNQLLSSIGESNGMPAPADFTLHASGGFISRKLAKQIIDTLTKNLLISYGSTEVAIASLESRVTDLEDMHWLEPTHIRHIEIVDSNGHICPVGREGQLRIQLKEQDCSSYLDDTEASKNVFSNGFFYPGDMAIRRADGRVRMLGRSAHVVNFRGQKHAVSPIEDNIQNFLNINSVCIFSGLNEAGEDEVVVAVESEQWPEKSHLNYLGNELEQDFGSVSFAIIYPFPRTQAGARKIDRTALRKIIFPLAQ